MIIDKIGNIKIYKGLQSRLDIAIDYIKTHDLSNLESGRHDIDGDNLFLLMNKYETKRVKAEVLEAHSKYIDLQYILEGEEIIEYTPFQNQEIIKEYDSQNDYALFRAEDAMKLIVNAGMFAVFFPNDLHMPGIISQKKSMVKKVVVKILLD